MEGRGQPYLFFGGASSSWMENVPPPSCLFLPPPAGARSSSTTEAEPKLSLPDSTITDGGASGNMMVSPPSAAAAALDPVGLECGEVLPPGLGDVGRGITRNEGLCFHNIRAFKCRAAPKGSSSSCGCPTQTMKCGFFTPSYLEKAFPNGRFGLQGF